MRMTMVFLENKDKENPQLETITRTMVNIKAYAQLLI